VLDDSPGSTPGAPMRVASEESPVNYWEASPGRTDQVVQEGALLQSPGAVLEGDSPLPLQEQADAFRGSKQRPYKTDPATTLEMWDAMQDADNNAHQIMDIEAINAVWQPGLDNSPAWADELIMQGDGHY